MGVSEKHRRLVESHEIMNGNDMKRVLFLGVSILWRHPDIAWEVFTSLMYDSVCMQYIVCISDGQFCSPFAPTISPPDKMKGMYQRLAQEDSTFRDDHVDPCCRHMQENTNEVYSFIFIM